MDAIRLGLWGLLIALAYFSILAGLQLGPVWFAGLAALLPLGGAIFVLGAWRDRRRLLERLHAEWGQPQPARQRDALELARAQRLRGVEPSLSDDTWNDLDLFEIFALLDRTLTSPGQIVLYERLRQPIRRVSEAARLRAELAQARALQHDVRARDTLQLALHALGSMPDGTVDLLTGASRLRAPSRVTWLLLAFAFLAPSAALLFGATTLAGGLAVLALLTNLAFHYSNFYRLSEALPALSFLQRLVSCGLALRKQPLPGFEAEGRELEALLTALRPLSRVLALVPLPPGVDDSLLAAVKAFLLLDELRLIRLAGLIERSAVPVRQLFDLLGRLDALQSLASVLAGATALTEAEFHEGPPSLKLEGLVHPLVRAAVPNSLELSGQLLITGSNTSGKSTFLRAVGVNVVLAQTLGVCFARSARATPFTLATALRRSDSVVQGVSTYLAEACGVRDVLRATEGPVPALCLLDEIFRGTNTEERIAAAGGVLRCLAERGAVVLAATHDSELCTLLAPPFANAHFGEAVGGAGLVFDYQLEAGPADTRNALLLLRQLGYPAAVLEHAQALVARKQDWAST